MNEKDGEKILLFYIAHVIIQASHRVLCHSIAIAAYIEWNVIRCKFCTSINENRELFTRCQRLLSSFRLSQSRATSLFSPWFYEDRLLMRYIRTKVLLVIKQILWLYLMSSSFMWTELKISVNGVPYFKLIAEKSTRTKCILEFWSFEDEQKKWK